MSYVWDERQRLKQVEEGDAIVASFQYDAFDRRVGKSINGVSTGFLNDGWQVVQELSGTTPSAHLLTGLNVDEIFRRTAGATVEDFLTDALGSTLALADSNGAIQAVYGYEPFGKTTPGGVASSNTYQYTGRENDGDMYYYRNRYYSPTIQRFISEDPIGLRGGINTYAYANGDPVRNSDPLGLEVGAAFGSINRHTAKWPDSSSSSCERCECWLTCLSEDPLLPDLLIGLGGPLVNLKGPGERRPGASPWTSVDRRLPPWTGANPNAGATVTRGTIQRVKCVGRYGTVAAAVGAFTAGYAVGAAGRCWVECL